jgi:hypothetical protein
VEVKIAPIEYDLEQILQRGDATVAVHMQAPPDWCVDLEEQDVELINCAGSVWLDHSGPRSLVAAVSAPGFSRSPIWSKLRLLCPPVSNAWRPIDGHGFNARLQQVNVLLPPFCTWFRAM